MLGEEFPEKTGESGGRWILDPIDGTKSFVRGVPLYSTLLAYESPEGMEFGAISSPSAGYLVFAQRGRGCYDEHGARLQVSRREQLEEAYILSTWLEDWPAELFGRMNAQGAIMRSWGDGFGYTLLAMGGADALVDYTVQPFGIAPVPVIIGEAGGFFSDFAGSPSIHSGNCVAAATPELHARLRAEVLTEAPDAGGPGSSR